MCAFDVLLWIRIVVFDAQSAGSFGAAHVCQHISWWYVYIFVNFIPTINITAHVDVIHFIINDPGGYESDGSSRKLAIRDQLAQLIGDRDDDFSIPLGKNLKKVSAKLLTVSQKRNIKRQAYLDEVSQRNDTVFFATIGAFVILPPLIILAIAILTGYVQLFPWYINILLHTNSSLLLTPIKFCYWLARYVVISLSLLYVIHI